MNLMMQRDMEALRGYVSGPVSHSLEWLSSGLSPGLSELIRSVLPTEFTTPTTSSSHSTRLEARRDGHILGVCPRPWACLALCLGFCLLPPSLYSIWTPPVSAARATQS